MGMPWNSAAHTHVGKVRARNEDAILDRPGLWAVADGMGGHQSGDLASRLIIETLADLSLSGSLLQRQQRLDEQVQRINRHLHLGLTLSENHPDLLVGSTLVALLIEQDRALCTWVGDSRCYLLRSRRLYQLSRDHSLQQTLIDEQGMSPEQAAREPDAHALTRAIGADETLQLDSLELDCLPGDVFLLCSDGLHQSLPRERLADALTRNEPRHAVHQLFEQVLQGEAHDNISAVVISR